MSSKNTSHLNVKMCALYANVDLSIKFNVNAIVKYQ